MVDPERLGRVVARVRDDVATLTGLTHEHDLTQDRMALDAASYLFVTAIEGCTRAAQHVIASEALAMPQSNADAIRAPGRYGIVAEGLAEPVALAVSFRDVLVHGYAEVDDDVVRANVALLPDVEAFVAALADWASRQP